MEKYQTPAIATMHAPKIILRISGVISVSSLSIEYPTRTRLSYSVQHFVGACEILAENLTPR
jgi:hypothetical protein